MDYLPTLWTVLALLSVVVVGALFRIAGAIKREHIFVINRFVFMACLPFLVFKACGITFIGVTLFSQPKGLRARLDLRSVLFAFENCRSFDLHPVPSLCQIVHARAVHLDVHGDHLGRHHRLWNSDSLVSFWSVCWLALPCSCFNLKLHLSTPVHAGDVRTEQNSEPTREGV